jgi:hypothetical protein
MGDNGNVYTVLVDTTEGKRPLARHRRRWKNNIKMTHEGIECEGMNWINQGQVRYQWRVTLNSIMSFGLNKMGKVC